MSSIAMWWGSSTDLSLVPRLFHCTSFMANWGRNFLQKFRNKLKNCKVWVEQLRSSTDESQVIEFFNEKRCLAKLLEDEELYWKQRAKNFWLENGDLNTKFFHAQASGRKAANKVSSLVDVNGIVQSDLSTMGSIALSYVRNLFSLGLPNFDGLEISLIDVVSLEENESLVAPFSKEEFIKAIKQMHPEKSSGPNGLNPGFYQCFWTLIGDQIFSATSQCLSTGAFPLGLNNTLIVLIPKCENPFSMTELRSISLCNVLYKLVAKVLVNRMKDVLCRLISPSQANFVPGCCITNNIFLASEVLHCLKRRTRGRIGDVALKLDISKAYDRVDWGFLQFMLRKMGFAEQWISWLMLCISTVGYSVFFNGTIVGSIVPGRGLRQGYPLLPYLFIVCVERLSTMIRDSKARGALHGCSVCRNAPSISHLFFTDDSYLFFKSSLVEAEVVRDILSRFKQVSGQAVNYGKFEVMFSSNIHTDKQNEIIGMLGVDVTDGNSYNLGLPSVLGRSKWFIFRFLKDRLCKRLSSWQRKLLSRVGKNILIKTVAQALPTYSMGVFLILPSVLEELQKMLNLFWRGS